MTERDLSTMLNDHLADEPPVGHSSSDVIRTARRQSALRRGAAIGGGALAVAAVVALGLGGASVLGSDQPEPVTVAQEPPAAPLTTTMEAAAVDAYTPYVGALGEPDWSIGALLGDEVPEGDPTAQTYQLSYYPGGGTVQVNLSVGGYAPSDFEKYSFASACDYQLAQNLSASCETTTLEDGSLLTVEIAPRSRIQSEAPRLMTLEEASRLSGEVAWMRVVSLSTLDGMAVDASEYVRADDLASVEWQVPIETLKSLVLDSGLRDAEVAHEPMPEFTEE